MFLFQANEKLHNEPVHLSGDEKEDEDLDGVPLDGAALLKSAMMRGIPGAPAVNSPSRDHLSNKLANHGRDDSDYDDDIDGIPCNFIFIIHTKKKQYLFKMYLQWMMILTVFHLKKFLLL